jgi:Flp pilus assembly protein TadG
MIVRKPASRRRWGAAAVETALVLIPFTIFFFGVFEFGRLLMDWNVMNNAAREGCRYALVNNTNSTINTDVQNVVNTYMGRETVNYSNLSITVSGTHNGVSTPVKDLAAGDSITVTISGQYNFLNIIPFCPMSSMTMSSACTMVCEGAT